MSNVNAKECNTSIAEMLADGEQLKNFYRFVAQNPHINLHDACQIIIERPNATVCLSFNEWAAMGRRVTKGRKGIAYYDYDGYKQFVFDANDTHGDKRYSRPILPMKRLLGGLDELNGPEYAEEEKSDYRKIHKGVELYLQEQDALTGDDERDKLLIDGIAYSLYSKTGFPKSVGIGFSGLPYSYKENAEFIKDVYIRADMLAQDIEEAYSENKEEIKIIDDTEEEAVSDEPVVSVKHTEQVLEKPNHPLYPMYEQYKKAQKTNPNAIVLMRYGDFYEAFDDSAKTLSKELDLTLTGRDFGLPERVPMCGMPYHAMDKYLDKILAFSGVLLIEPNEEPKYILSHEELLEQSETPKEKQKPVLTKIADDESTPFDDEQSNNEWRNELMSELGETDDEQSEEETEFDESVQSEEIDDEDLDDAEAEDEDEFDETDEQPESTSEQPKDKVKSTPKKPEKGIKDRKRKEKPQLSMFDLFNPQEKSRLEQIIETDLKYGSGVEHGKFRIFDKYNENPSEKAFAEFLKKEYGWGGRSGYGGICEDHSPKGVKIYLQGEKGENLEQTFLKWPEVANRIADLIDDDNYLSEQEKQKYVEYTTEQNRQKELRAEEERRKNELINQTAYFRRVCGHDQAHGICGVS